MTGGQHVHWLPIGFAALLTLMSAWLNQVAEHPQVLDNAGFTHDPDYIVEHFKVQAFDISGRPRHRLIAQRMIHYMDDDTTELDQPRFRLTTAGQAPVDVSSRRGLMFGDRESVHFLGDVRATRSATRDQSAFILTGEHLRVVPDAGLLSSDKPVTLRQGKSVIHAGGLYLNDHNKQLELTGGVRGLYEKTH
ncbi:MAG: LPS export ABC transporter periplasmic protein LptC [Gallionellaceae bacterium]|nr:LPS export ABC transporter periplasmic protein LptC [Gallionellaceae bacterium]